MEGCRFLTKREISNNSSLNQGKLPVQAISQNPFLMILPAYLPDPPNSRSMVLDFEE